MLWCATRATSLRDGLVNAVQLGGDTDTVAALVGGLMGGNLTAEQIRADLPWHQLVMLPEPASAITDTASALATIRTIRQCETWCWILYGLTNVYREPAIALCFHMCRRG